MSLYREKSYLVIADPCYRDLLIGWKSKDPQLDVKIVDREEAVSMLSFSYAKDPLPYLFTKQRYSYADLKQLSRILQRGKLDKGGSLSNLREELSSRGYLVRDVLGRHQLQEKEILLFEDDEDEELKGLLLGEGLSYGLLHFSDIGQERRDFTQRPIYLFPDKAHQFSFLFADMREKILREGRKASAFEIVVHDDQDRYYVNLLSSLFAVPAFFDYRYPLLSLSSVKKAMDGFGKTGKISREGIEEDPGTKRLFQLIDYYGLVDLPFDYAFPNLLEIVKSEAYSEEGQTGVLATSRLSFSERKTYYVTNFQHGDFYAVHSDRGLFSDEELVRMGINPSYVQTKLDKRKKANFFKYMDVVFFSRVERHLSDKIFPSQLLEEVPSEEGKKPFREMKKESFDSGLYTKEAALFVRSLAKDAAFASPDEEYRCYDNRYTKIDGISSKTSFGITEFSKYYACPFQYYLDKVLHLDDKNPEQDYFARKFGDFVHSIFENIYEDDFDFEKEFERAEKRFEEESAASEEKKADERERALIQMSKPYLSRFVENVRRQKDIMGFVREEHEVKVEFPLHSAKTGKDYRINGRIDKILHTRHGEKSFYAIIDYKTGSETFDYQTVFLGNSLQLPLYYVGIREREREETFALFGIEKIFKKGPLKTYATQSYDREAVEDYMKVRGIALSDPDFFRSIDDEKAFTSKGLLGANGGTYVSKTLSFSEESSAGLKKSISYTFDDLIDDALKAAVETMDKTQDAEFAIAPVIEKASAEPRCGHCSYRDVCYRKRSDIVNLADAIRKHIGAAGDDKPGEED